MKKIGIIIVSFLLPLSAFASGTIVAGWGYSGTYTTAPENSLSVGGYSITTSAHTDCWYEADFGIYGLMCIPNGTTTSGVVLASYYIADSGVLRTSVVATTNTNFTYTPVTLVDPAVTGEGTATINGGANVTVTKSTSNVFTTVLTVGASGITANAENPTFTIPAGFTAPNATPVANAGLVVADGNWSVVGGATCLVDSPSVGLTAAVGQVITVDVTAACTVGTGGTITLTYKGTSSTAMGVTPLNIGVNDVISYSPVVPINNPPTITVTDTVTETTGPVFIDTNKNGTFDSGELSFNTIQAAITAAAPGDTIIVGAGTYNESLNITKSVILQSTGGRDVTTIKSLTIATSSVTVSGFTIEGVNASNVASTNILLNSGVSNITVSNNKIINVGSGSNSSNGDSGVGLLTTSDLVHIGDNLNVTGNIFQALDTGSNRAFFINPGINNFTFSGNTITGNFTHAATTQAKNGLVENNTITGAGAVGSRSAGFRAWGYPNPTVWGHTTFSGNTVSGAKRGITADEANNVTITGNTLSGNEMGVWVTANDSLPFDITTISVHNNNLSGEDTLGFGVINDTASTTPMTKVDASSNWWGSAVLADVTAKISGNVNYDPYYIDIGMTTTNTDVAALAAAKTTAHGTLTTALGTYTQSNYSGANWITLNGFKITGDTNIDAAGTTNAVTSAQNTATTAMAGVVKATQTTNPVSTNPVSTNPVSSGGGGHLPTTITTELSPIATITPTKTTITTENPLIFIAKNIVPIVVNVLTGNPPLSGIASAPVPAKVPPISENPSLFDIISQPVPQTPQNRTPFIIIAIAAWILIASLALFIVRRITSYMIMSKVKKDIRNVEIKKNETIH